MWFRYIQGFDLVLFITSSVDTGGHATCACFWLTSIRSSPKATIFHFLPMKVKTCMNVFFLIEMIATRKERLFLSDTLECLRLFPQHMQRYSFCSPVSCCHDNYRDHQVTDSSVVLSDHSFSSQTEMSCWCGRVTAGFLFHTIATCSSDVHFLVPV